MMQTWSVFIEFAGNGLTDPDEINSRLESLLVKLERFGATVGGTPDEPDDSLGRYSAQLAVEADSPIDAVASSLPAVMSAAKEAGLPEWPIVRLELLDWADFERSLQQPTYPELLGVKELADLLSVSKQRASELARSTTFPRPLTELASGPVWLAPNVQRFLRGWQRRPGRPTRAENQ